MRNVLVPLVFGALTFLGSAASADELPPETKKPELPRWRGDHFIEYAATIESGSFSIVHGAEASYAFHPRLRVGAATQFPVAAYAPEYCGQPEMRDCNFASFALRGFAELHAIPTFVVDPWIRAGLGPVVHVSKDGETSFDFARPDFAVFAAVGVDVNLAFVFLSPYAMVSAFTGEQPHLWGGGARIGLQF